MIVIIGKIDAVRKAAYSRKIPLDEAAMEPKKANLPFSRRRLSDMRLSQMIRGFSHDPEQIVVIAEVDKEDSFQLIMPDEAGDTEISLDQDFLVSGRFPDFIAELAPIAMADPWRGRHVDIRA